MIYSINKEHPTRHFFRGTEYDYKVRACSFNPQMMEIYNGETCPISPVKNAYFLGWGIFTTDDSGNIGFHDFDGKAFISAAKKAKIYNEAGKSGWKAHNGDIVLPALFDQVEVGRDFVFLLQGEHCTQVNESGYSRWYAQHNSEEGDFIVENGKKGWKRLGKVVFPPMFDNIKKWYGFDVYATENDGLVRYLDESGNEVLKDDNMRDIHHFWPVTNSKHMITCMQLVSEVGPNVVRNEGNLIKVSRMSNEAIHEEFSRFHDGMIPFSDSMLELYDNDFSYEFHAFRAYSSGNNRVNRCLDQFAVLPVYSNSWHYVLSVRVAPGNDLSAEELRKIRYTFEDLESRTLSLQISIVYDKGLPEDAVEMFLISHYNERCWPASFEMDFWDDCNTCSLEELKTRLDRLKLKIEESVKPKYRTEVWEDQINRIIVGMKYNNRRSWAESLRVLEYFKEYGSKYKRNLHWMLDCIDCCSDFMAYKEILFISRRAIWALKNGAEPNIIKDCQTPLDMVDSGIEFLKRVGDPDKSKMKLACLEKLRCKMSSLGCLTKEELRERNCETDVEKEIEAFLDIMRTD